MTQQDIKHSAQQPDATSQERKGILSQLSMPAILAAVLTSVTSFLLSSKLGLTGSLIGAAIAAAVSTTASQLYNAMIKTSMERIQDLTDDMVARSQGRRDTTAIPTRDTSQNDTRNYVPGGMRLAPEQLRQEAAHRRTVQVARRSFAVALAAALVALLAYTAVVNVATQGQGIGPTSIQEFSAPSAPTETETQQDPATYSATTVSSATTDAATGSTQDQAGTTSAVEQTDAAGAAGQTDTAGAAGQTDTAGTSGQTDSSSVNGNASTSESTTTGTASGANTNGATDSEATTSSTDDPQDSATLH